MDDFMYDLEDFMCDTEDFFINAVYNQQFQLESWIRSGHKVPTKPRQYKLKANERPCILWKSWNNDGFVEEYDTKGRVWIDDEVIGTWYMKDQKVIIEIG